MLAITNTMREGRGCGAMARGNVGEDASGALADAVRSGEIVTLVYAAGSQAGTKRDVVPVSVGGGVLKARCLASDTVKSYKLALLEIVPHDAPFPAYRAASSSAPTARGDITLGMVLDAHEAELDALGWKVVHSEEAITLHRKAGGDPSVIVGLGLARTSTKATWVIAAADAKRRSRKRLDSAVLLFMDAARRCGEPQDRDGDAHVAKADPPSNATAFHGGMLSIAKGALWAFLAFLAGLSLGVLYSVAG